MQEDADLAKFIKINFNAVFLDLILESIPTTQTVSEEEVQQKPELKQWSKSVLLLKIWSSQGKRQSQELRSGGLIQTNEEVDRKEVV